ncbi:related to SPO22 Protein involved in completion of nuclear divisions during meiosis [Rhynchosporium agropyri]|uniref:Related to SPO22 Protein involved in completion of nuclear divisions during meiosis n=1 Tax=Rhynchosporium agropyri TaxID=914238 RepID=A0A1E1KMX8_9HELO|nr:related to SPO22 Protein involved in completion of nuclear divisions during meiosis [Rhynchosporium agropyri]
MAPAQAPRLVKDQRLKNILAYAGELEAALPAAIATRTSTSTAHELEKQISNFPENLSISVSAKCDELDRSGTTIWNLCTRLRRDYDSNKPQEMPILLLLARVYSFLMLDCAHSSGKSTGPNLVRIMKTGLKAAKNCVCSKQNVVALKVLGKISAYEGLLQKNEDLDTEEREGCERLVVEYYILRTAVSWHQEEFNTAEHMFAKSMAAKHIFDPGTAESLADILYEMGKDLLAKQKYPMAVKWLERAEGVLDGQEPDRLSMDASELRTSILQSLIKALLATKEPESTQRARGLVSLLERDLGDKLVVLLLKLEVLSAPTTDNVIAFDSPSYLDLVQRMIRTVFLNDGNFKLIMSHIRKLNDKSPSLATKALDDFLILRIVHEEREEWFEKALVTRLWIAASQSDISDSLAQIEDLFSTLVASSTKPASPAATLAAHTLLWKRIEANCAIGQYEVAEKWCHLAMHKIFAKSGELNMARLSRKLLICALSKKDIESARGIFSSMPSAAQNEAMSRFLMYKIAIRCDEEELAAECLQIINAASPNDPKLLYACVLEAQQAGNKRQTLAALQLVLDKSTYETAAVNLASLLRLTITLTVQTLDDAAKNRSDPTEFDNTLEKLCAMYETGCAAARKARVVKGQANATWTIDELQWFSKNSYNLVIKHLAVWDLSHLLRMLVCCIDFIDQYPKDMNQQMNDDLSLRRMFCDFMTATSLVSLARGEDNIETQLQYLLRLRKHVKSFDAQLQDKAGNLEDDAEADLRKKLSILAAFDFEAACKLKAWDDLGEIVLKAEACKSTQVFEIMADIIMCSEASDTVLVHTIKKIINEMWGTGLVDISKLARYLRCMIHITITDSTDIAGGLLDHVYEYAKAASETEQLFPAEELEWVVTTAFNRAVDFFCAGDEQTAKDWAGKALNIAQCCADGGGLERLLQSKLLELNLGP